MKDFVFTVSLITFSMFLSSRLFPSKHVFCSKLFLVLLKIYHLNHRKQYVYQVA